MFLGAWLGLPLGLKDEWDAALEANLSTNNADAITECEEETFEVEGFNSYLDGGEGVLRLLISITDLLGVEGWMYFDSSQYRL